MSYCLLFCVLFFFKRKTAYEMRISDWSSDVCSSDLLCLRARGIGFGEQALALRAARKRLIKRAGRIGVRDRRVIDRDGARSDAGIADELEHPHQRRLTLGLGRRELLADLRRTRARERQVGDRKSTRLDSRPNSVSHMPSTD